jgi:hypothetical protein
LKNPLRLLYESVRGGGAGKLLNATSSAFGESPTITFADYLDAYVKDPACGAFVDFLSDQAVGMGFYTTCAEDYEEAVAAKKAVDEFCEQVNLDGLLQIGVREIVASGNSFWEKIEPDKLVNLSILPLTSIDRIKRDQKGNTQAYAQSREYGGTSLDPKRIIHFCWNPVDREPFGRGILQSLLEEFEIGSGEKRMSFLKMKARIENIMPKIIEKYAGPDEVWSIPGAKDDTATTLQNLLKKKPKEGARFVWNGKEPATISTVQVDPRSRFEAYIDHIMGQINMGGQSPVSALLIDPKYATKATAESAAALVERKVMALQRFIKRIIEKEIFDPTVKQAGLDPQKASVRLNWGIPEKPDINALLPVLAQIVIARPDVITTPELRNILIDLGLPLEKVEAQKQ